MLWTVSKVTRNCLLISNLKTSNNNYKTSNNNVSAYDAVERLQPLMISVHTLSLSGVLLRHILTGF